MSVAHLLAGWCFFFFKQKTAYEMRISDWSSDVCSSDLEDAAACQNEACLGRGELVVRRSRHRSGANFGRGRLGDDAAQRARRINVDLGFVNLVDGRNARAEPFDGALHLVHADIGHDKARAFGVKRSEEHTSELQSL